MQPRITIVFSLLAMPCSFTKPLYRSSFIAPFERIKSLHPKTNYAFVRDDFKLL